MYWLVNKQWCLKCIEDNGIAMNSSQKSTFSFSLKTNRRMTKFRAFFPLAISLNDIYWLKPVTMTTSYIIYSKTFYRWVFHNSHILKSVGHLEIRLIYFATYTTFWLWNQILLLLSNDWRSVRKSICSYI